MKSAAENNMTMMNFAFLWFGAAVSVAEILAGGLLAPLGFAKGMAAILLGHVIGTTILVLGGIIGAETRMPSIRSTRISFGDYGSYLFSGLNVLQLVGWTAVMIIAAARSLNKITTVLWSFDSVILWSVVIGIIIAVWLLLGRTGWKKINSAAVVLLFFLTLILCAVTFKDGTVFTKEVGGSMSFGAAVELSVVMPLSWLPLISDYTRFAKSAKAGVAGTWVGYFLGSCLMYTIGLGAAIAAGDADPASMMLAAGLGLAALGIVLVSTVTTTFLDAYSAGVSLVNIFSGLHEKHMAVLATAAGTVLAVLIDIEQYENFLYAIGSVFAPLFAVLLADYFVIGQREIPRGMLLDWSAALMWMFGVAAYYQFIKYDFVFGATVPVMLVTGTVHVLVRRWLIKSKLAARFQYVCNKKG